MCYIWMLACQLTLKPPVYFVLALFQWLLLFFAVKGIIKFFFLCEVTLSAGSKYREVSFCVNITTIHENVSVVYGDTCRGTLVHPCRTC